MELPESRPAIQHFNGYRPQKDRMPPKTKTPWHQDKSSPLEIRAGDRFLIAKAQIRDDAAFIVEAVNMHEELIKIAHTAMTLLQERSEKRNSKEEQMVANIARFLHKEGKPE